MVSFIDLRNFVLLTALLNNDYSLQRKNMTAILPRTVSGLTSPYPTVEQVTIRNQMASR